MSWINKIFRKQKDEMDHSLSKEDQMLLKLENSILHCNDEIKKATEESDQIKKWSIEAITEVFQVPNRFWYEELEKYDEIKKLDENKSVDSKVLQKCDEVVFGYRDQIKLRHAKVLLYNALIEKYIGTKQKMEEIKKSSQDQAAAIEKLRSLERHSQRLDQLRNSPENLNGHLEGTDQLEMMKNEAKEVIEEFEISEEVKTTLQEINQQFDSGKYGQGAESAIAEIERLTDRIKKQD
jgi:hypothetical protein